MQEIRALMRELNWDETRMMNYLQNWGQVSDNAIWLKDCAEDDLASGAAFLRERIHQNQP